MFCVWEEVEEEVEEDDVGAFEEKSFSVLNTRRRLLRKHADCPARIFATMRGSLPTLSRCRCVMMEYDWTGVL
jgi:hypothetical protein